MDVNRRWMGAYTMGYREPTFRYTQEPDLKGREKGKW